MRFPMNTKSYIFDYTLNYQTSLVLCGICLSIGTIVEIKSRNENISYYRRKDVHLGRENYITC